MAAGKFRFGKIISRIQQQDRSDSVPDPAHRIKLQAGAFVEYVGDRSAARIVVEAPDADALLAYRAMWCQRLVEGVSYGVPAPPPGVRVWLESAKAVASDNGKTVRPGSHSGSESDDTRSDSP